MNKIPYHIRPISIEDVASYLSLMNTNRKRLKLYFPISSSKVKNRRTAKKFIQEKLINVEEKTQFAFVIELLETKELTGYIIIKNLDWNESACELAYWLGEGYEGQGMMSYSMKHIIRFCFNYLQLNRVYLRIDPENRKSRTLAKRSGFTIHHTAEKEYRRGDNVWVDVEYWELLSPKK